MKETLLRERKEPCSAMDEDDFHHMFAASGRDVEAEYDRWMYELYGYDYPYLSESRRLKLQTGTSIR
jgi:hypothetical protein